MKAESVQSDVPCGSSYEVTEIRYSLGQLDIAISGKTSEACIVTFEEVAGFRVLDEGDLLEFWPECSFDRGWLFRILDGGWFSQESERSGFLARDTKIVTEYLVTGVNECVNVLSWSEPKVSRLFASGATSALERES